MLLGASEPMTNYRNYSMHLSLVYSCHHQIARWITIASAATISILTSNPPGSAQLRLLPTALSTGDCVAPTISMVKTAAHRALDRQYCTEKNPGNPQQIQTCQQNIAARTQVAFFTDRCTSKNYFLGIDGVEYPLKRTGGNATLPPYLTGSFTGKGIRFDVKQIRSIKQNNEDGVPSGEVEVLVTITQGKKTEKIKGLLVYGP
jgi:hypothetical protein